MQGDEVFCRECGQAVEEGESFCSGCGRELPVETDGGGDGATQTRSAAREASDELEQPMEDASAPPAAAAPPAPAVPSKPLEYRVVPFSADIQSGQGSSTAAAQLAELLNQQSRMGWRFLRMETLLTRVTTPGNKGCFGFGATPDTVSQVEVYVVVFARP